jgi:hypothetical protein
VSEVRINDDKPEQRPSNTSAKDFKAQVNAFEVLCGSVNLVAGNDEARTRWTEQK